MAKPSVLSTVSLALLSLILIANGSHARQPMNSLTEILQEEEDGANEGRDQSLSDMDRREASLAKQKAELEYIKDSLQNFAREIAAQVEQNPRVVELSSPYAHTAFRQALFAKGMDQDEVDSIMDDALKRMRSRLYGYKKRGWNRVSVQTRFAPFGTKLVPNRKLDNGGATLLRYGRSAEN